MSIYQSQMYKLLRSAYLNTELTENKIIISSKTFTNMILSENYNLPLHLRNFFTSIQNTSSLEEFEQILESSLNKLSMERCTICKTCTGCCESFFASLSDKFILVENGFSADKINKWKQISNNIAEKYGEYNFSAIPPDIKKHLIPQNSILSLYNSQKEKICATRDIENSLIVLKGLSSSTPYLYNGFLNVGHFTGGGIFLNWNNLGIVIDPGFGFVENMQKNKIFIDDIDVVIITHFHIDHTNDIRLLDDLNRTINTKLVDFENPDDYEKYKKIKNKDIGDFHKISWYVDTDTKKDLMGNLNPLINDIKIIDEININTDIKISTDITFHPFPTKHVQTNFLNDNNKPERIFKKNTFGFTLKLQTNSKKSDVIFGYTSDTTYSHKLLDYLSGVTCLIANISGIYEDDYLEFSYKARHLGYAGCKKIIENISPDITIISEFWNGITDLRFDVCRDLQSKTKEKVLPGEVGLQLKLSPSQIRCSICGNYSNLKKVSVIAPTEQMAKLNFVCDKCRY